MSYASLMVSVDLGEAARSRIRLAGHLADAFKARPDRRSGRDAGL